MTALPLATAGEAYAWVRPLLDARPLLLVSDFDGTLAHLQPDPWGARILPGARRALRALAARPGVHVALLSGRTAGDLAGRVRVGGALYLGDHGSERGRLPRGGRAERLAIEVAPQPPHYTELAEAVARAVEAAVPEPWLVVERKLPAVTFHFRTAPDLPATAARIGALVDGADPSAELIRFLGRRAIELRPPGAPAKADSLRALLDEHRPAAAIMLGDDRHDAAAFALLRAARSAGELAGCAIGVVSLAATPEEIAPHADLVLASPAETAGLLGRIERHVR